MFVLSAASYLLTFLVFLPLVRNSYWVFRILEYPRFQKFLLIVLVLGIWGIYGISYSRNVDLPALGLLAVAAGYLAYKIYPYTTLAPKEVKSIKQPDKNRSIKILAANVLQDNREYGRLLAQIEQADPDIILLLETDHAWANGVASLKEKYPYHLLEPLDNTYGLLFYSRYKVKEHRVCYLVKDDIPSVDAVIELPDSTDIQLWGLHPEPPVPGESMTSTAKDKELMKVALKAKDCKRPIIVMGDLNDVAWSYTTSLFTRTSGLLDVRKGRGFYSTFSAKSRLVRFPLDYIFCSNDFGMVSMKRLPYNGSDHFAMLTNLVYHPTVAAEQPEPDACEDDIDTAKEIASQSLEDSEK